VSLTSCTDMLMSLSSALSSLSTPPCISHDKVGRRTCKIVVSSLQLLQVLIIDQSLLPEVLKEVEIRATGSQSLAKDAVVKAHMLHTLLPGYPSVVTCVLELVAQWALNRLGRLLAPEMAQAVRGPFLLVVRYIRATQEPERALVRGLSDLCQPLLEHAVVVLQQRYAREATRQARADRCLGGCGVRVVVE
jgi:hypothetical protein